MGASGSRDIVNSKSIFTRVFVGSSPIGTMVILAWMAPVLRTSSLLFLSAAAFSGSAAAAFWAAWPLDCLLLGIFNCRVV